MLDRCAQMADAFVSHLRRSAGRQGHEGAAAAMAAAAAALSRDALLANIHYFRCRDHVEQASVGCVVA